MSFHANSNNRLRQKMPIRARPHVANVRSISRRFRISEPRLYDLVMLDKLGKKVRVPPSGAIRFARSISLALA